MTKMDLHADDPLVLLLNTTQVTLGFSKLHQFQVTSMVVGSISWPRSTRACEVSWTFQPQWYRIHPCNRHQGDEAIRCNAISMDRGHASAATLLTSFSIYQAPSHRRWTRRPCSTKSQDQPWIQRRPWRLRRPTWRGSMMVASDFEIRRNPSAIWSSYRQFGFAGPIPKAQNKNSIGAYGFCMRRN